MSERLRIMPYASEGNQTGIAAEYSLGGPDAIGVRAVTPPDDNRGSA